MGFHRQRTMWLWRNLDNVTHRQLLSIDQVWRRSTTLTWSRWGCRRLADNIWLLAHDNNNTAVERCHWSVAVLCHVVIYRIAVEQVGLLVSRCHFLCSREFLPSDILSTEQDNCHYLLMSVVTLVGSLWTGHTSMWCEQLSLVVKYLSVKLSAKFKSSF